MIFYIFLIAAGVLVALFAITFTVYMLNLDMKLTSLLFPLFQKHYDKMKRDQHL